MTAGPCRKRDAHLVSFGCSCGKYRQESGGSLAHVRAAWLVHKSARRAGARALAGRPGHIWTKVVEETLKSGRRLADVFRDTSIPACWAAKCSRPRAKKGPRTQEEEHTGMFTKIHKEDEGRKRFHPHRTPGGDHHHRHPGRHRHPDLPGPAVQSSGRSAKSLVRNAMTAMESAYVDSRTYDPATVDADVLDRHRAVDHLHC